MITYHRNLTRDKPILLKLTDIYRNSNLFDLSAANYVNKQKLERSLKYVVERKVTSKDIEAIYTEEEEKIHPWETDKIKELIECHNLESALIKINDLMNYRRNYLDIVKKLDNLLVNLTKESGLKIFSSARFCKMENEQYIELYPNKALIDEIKKINYSMGKKNTSSY